MNHEANQFAYFVPFASPCKAEDWSLAATLAENCVDPGDQHKKRRQVGATP